MLRIQRSKAPPGFASHANRASKLARAFHEGPARERQQKRFTFTMSPAWAKLVLPALSAQFSNKCAYCETRLDTIDRSNIDWLRPYSGVAEVTGKFLPDHYWAQAYCWENMYLSCHRCNRAKGNRFPVKKGTRAEAAADRAGLAMEAPLLLDPCEDDPANHLLFTPDGFVAGLDDRGRTTIEVLDLNRIDLTEQRASQATRYSDAVSREGEDGPTPVHMRSREQPFLGALLSLTKGAQARAKRARADQRSYDETREQVSVEDKSPLLLDRARFIRRVEIQNIASITKLGLDLDASASVSAPAFALLGVNGVGKSTILKAIALALAGPAHRASTGVKAKDFLRSGAAKGRVTIWLSGFKEPIVMDIVRDTGRFTFRQTKSRSLVLAYGSSRLLPTPDNRPPPWRRDKASAKIRNLFNPYLPLTDISSWLASVPAQYFDDAAMTLKSLLPIDNDAILVRDQGGAVRVRFGEGPAQRFDLLSDGYQSMLGLAADIMQTMYRHNFDSMRIAQGIVLIDELGNHLHPRWRMEILRSFRKAFPQVQFIFSTHDPLCLRGLSEGEVAVIKRGPKGNVYALENLPSIEHMRVDQLLASEHFGLGSMVEPWADNMADEFQVLAAKDPKERTAAEKEDYESARRAILDPRLLGQTRPQRIYYEAIARETEEALDDKAGSIDASALDERVISQIRKLMQKARGAGTRLRASRKKKAAGRTS